MSARHPIQPLETDYHGVVRFKRNAIVESLLEAGPLDLNDLAELTFSREDREQFAQLIGYSLSGFGDLSYVSDETYEAAAAMSADPALGSLQARCDALEAKLASVRAGMRAAVADLYGIHPDDLGDAVSDV